MQPLCWAAVLLHVGATWARAQERPLDVVAFTNGQMVGGGGGDSKLYTPPTIPGLHNCVEGAGASRIWQLGSPGALLEDHANMVMRAEQQAPGRAISLLTRRYPCRTGPTMGFANEPNENKQDSGLAETARCPVVIKNATTPRSAVVIQPHSMELAFIAMPDRRLLMKRNGALLPHVTADTAPTRGDDFVYDSGYAYGVDRPLRYARILARVVQQMPPETKAVLVEPVPVHQARLLRNANGMRQRKRNAEDDDAMIIRIRGARQRLGVLWLQSELLRRGHAKFDGLTIPCGLAYEMAYLHGQEAARLALGSPVEQPTLATHTLCNIVAWLTLRGDQSWRRAHPAFFSTRIDMLLEVAQQNASDDGLGKGERRKRRRERSKNFAQTNYANSPAKLDAEEPQHPHYAHVEAYRLRIRSRGPRACLEPPPLGGATKKGPSTAPAAMQRFFWYRAFDALEAWSRMVATYRALSLGAPQDAPVLQVDRYAPFMFTEGNASAASAAALLQSASDVAASGGGALDAFAEAHGAAYLGYQQWRPAVLRADNLATARALPLPNVSRASLPGSAPRAFGGALSVDLRGS